MLITLCTNVKEFLLFQVDKKPMQFSTVCHNSADKVTEIKYVKRLINKFQLMLRCNLVMETFVNPIRNVTFLLNLSFSSSIPFHRVVFLRKMLRFMMTSDAHGTISK